MKYVTFYGGFHNCGAIRVRVSDEQYNEIANATDTWDNILSEGQMKRLERHFCGIRGCCCGGARLASIEL